MDNRILNTGPSSAGWHGYETFARCPRLWFLKSLQVKHDEEDGLDSKATGQGSLIHLMLAHHYGRTLPKYKRLYSPADALGHRCQDAELVLKLSETFDLYHKKYAESDKAYTVVDVECEYKTQFGIAPFTARIDLVLKEKSSGLIWFVDHKSTSKLNRRTMKRYELSGQLLGQYYLGERAFGKAFGGIVLNHIQTDGAKLEREIWLPRKQHHKVFPAKIEDLAERMAKAKASGLYVPALSEQVCFSPYGPCDCYDICYWRETEPKVRARR